MSKLILLKPGAKVRFIRDVGTKECPEIIEEKGIVKSMSDENHVFVVYKCAGEWDRYMSYTAARTKISDLRLGWGDE